jgi:flagellar P-ring protein precursor FlgI
VVVDERTGAIVMGQNVRISPIAISHGNLQIRIGAQAPTDAQAVAAAQGQAAAAAVASQAGQQPGVQADLPALALAETPTIVLFKGEVDLKEVVDGLNKIGASTQDLVQVLKIIKTAGALHADLEIR